MYVCMYVYIYIYIHTYIQGRFHSLEYFEILHQGIAQFLRIGADSVVSSKCFDVDLFSGISFWWLGWVGGFGT